LALTHRLTVLQFNSQLGRGIGVYSTLTDKGSTCAAMLVKGWVQSSGQSCM